MPFSIGFGPVRLYNRRGMRRRTSPTARVISLIIAIGLVTFIVIDSRRGPGDGGRQHKVVYSVTGNGVSEIAFQSPHGERRSSKVTLPWSKTFTANHFSNYSVDITIAPSGGDATCAISVDGRRRFSESASGANQIADCIFAN
jgi:hypothetical protein